MANVSNTVNVHNNAAVTNWISQINVGNTVYDIATHHGITFKDGSKGSSVLWNGLSDLEIVIPSITDIVQTPIEFAGTVNESGDITWNTGHGTEAKVGNLVFITKDCTFDDKPCEAGDMAIYAGSTEGWKVVSGENQVMIAAPMDTEGGNVATVAIGSSKDVLTVEGKTLALTLDYDDLNKHVDELWGDSELVDLSSVKVASKRIGLTQADSVSKTIGEQKPLTLATELKDGTVTFTGADNLVNSVTFSTLNQGKFPVYNKNTAAIELSVKGGALTNGVGSDFVTGVELGNISVSKAGTGDDAIKFSMVTGLSSSEGSTEFVKGIVTTNVSSEAAFTLKGYYVPTNGVNTTYVTGLGDGDDVVTNVTGGNFELVTGTTLATGFGAEANSGDVVSSVSVSTGTTDVFSGAKVENNVLSFTTSTVHSGNVTTTAKYKTLNKTGFKYTAPTVDKGGFTTAGFTKDSDVMYKVTTGKEKLWDVTTEYFKVNTPDVTENKGAYTINHDAMKAVVNADTFYTGMTAGELPTLNTGSVGYATLGGSVKKELSTKTETFNVLSANAIDMPGAYSIVDVATGGVEVGKAGALNDIDTALVNLEGYLTGVDIVAQKKA